MSFRFDKGAFGCGRTAQPSGLRTNLCALPQFVLFITPIRHLRTVYSSSAAVLVGQLAATGVVRIGRGTSPVAMICHDPLALHIGLYR